MNRKILIVEDDPSLSSIYERIARQSELDVIKVDSIEAFEKLFEELKGKVKEEISGVFTDDQIKINSMETRVQPYADKVVERCIQEGIPVENICIHSGTHFGHKIVQSIEKGGNMKSFEKIKTFFFNLKKST